MESRYKSLQSCWHGVKKMPAGEMSMNMDKSDDTIVMSRDSLLKLHVKVGTRVSLEYY